MDQLRRAAQERLTSLENVVSAKGHELEQQARVCQEREEALREAHAEMELLRKAGKEREVALHSAVREVQGKETEIRRLYQIAEERLTLIHSHQEALLSHAAAIEGLREDVRLHRDQLLEVSRARDAAVARGEELEEEVRNLRAEKLGLESSGPVSHSESNSVNENSVRTS